MTEQQAIEYFKMRLRERTHPPTTAQQKAFTLAIPALEKTSDKECSKCIERGKCAIYDNFNIDYCSDWRME